MRSAGVNFITAIIVLFAIGYNTTMAKAEFVHSDDDLYVDWFELAVNAERLASQLPPVEYGAFAIVETGGENLPVTYVIFSSFKGKRAVHGAFRCDKEFAVQATHSNGLYDIRCVKQNVFGEKITTVLRYNSFGLYEEYE